MFAAFVTFENAKTGVHHTFPVYAMTNGDMGAAQMDKLVQDVLTAKAGNEYSDGVWEHADLEPHDCYTTAECRAIALMRF